MDAKNAISLSKKIFQELFSEEDIRNVGLEEIEYDDVRNLWKITLGFNRIVTAQDEWRLALPLDRVYKIIAISDDGRLISVTNREILRA